jgi:hypothetical protein
MMLLANGETPPELNEDETAEWLAGIDRHCDGLDVVPGGEHSYADGCRNVDENGTWIGTTDCDCETQEFSWSSCDVCNTRLGGSRHAVTYFAKETR